MPYLVVDNTGLKVVKITQTMQQAEYWGDLAVPGTHDFSVRGTEARDFTPYSHEELTAMYQNTFGRRLSDMTPYNHTIREIREMLKDMDIDDTPIEQLKQEMKRRFGREEPLGWVPPTPEQVKAMRGPGSHGPPKARRTPEEELAYRAEQRERRANTPAARPKAGSQTGRVWEIGDQVKEANPELSGKSLRAKVIAAAVAEGINQGTAQVQAGKWLKALPA